MFRLVMLFGLIAGVTVAVPMVSLAFAMRGQEPPALGMAVGFLSMLVAFSAVFLGVKHRRDRELGGVIRFWPALGTGLAISAVASVVYVVAWEAVLVATGSEFIDAYVRASIAAKQANGVTGAELVAYTAEMQRFRAQYENPFFRLPVSFSEIFPVGALVSLVSAALLRNSRFLPARAARGRSVEPA